VIGKDVSEVIDEESTCLRKVEIEREEVNEVCRAETAEGKFELKNRSGYAASAEDALRSTHVSGIRCRDRLALRRENRCWNPKVREEAETTSVDEPPTKLDCMARLASKNRLLVHQGRVKDRGRVREDDDVAEVELSCRDLH